MNKNISILKDKKINYIAIEDKTIKDKITFDDNRFYDYYEGVFNYISINNRINNTYKILNEMNNDDLKLELMLKIEDLLKL